MNDILLSRLRTGAITRSAEETRELGRKIGETLAPASILALHGNLGVGKTTFVQGLATGLGIQGTITSPTYTVFTLYEGSRGRLMHLDAYRLNGEQEVHGLMLEDFLVDPWFLAAEWPDRLGSWLPRHALHLELSILPDQTHQLRLL